MAPRFLVSIVSYRLESGLAQCVQSVRMAGGNFFLHLTSNGSQPVTDWIRAHPGGRGEERVVINSRNLGFITPNNEAFRYACANGFNYMVTLNDDATVPAGWLDRFLDEFRRNPAAALVGCRGTCTMLNHNFHGYAGPELEYIEGSAMAIDVAKVQGHFGHLFSPYLDFMYGEDADLSLRMRRLGYTIHRANFELEHRRCSTTRHVPKAAQSQERNHAVLCERWSHYLKVRTFSHRIIVRRWHAHGDVLLTTPIIHTLWETNPQAEICVETTCPAVLSGNPRIAAIGQGFLRRATDQVIDLDGAYEKAPMRSILTSYARAAGLEEWRNHTEAFTTPGDMVWACEHVPPTDNPRIAIHVGPSSWPSKNWPVERWATVIDDLRQSGRQVVLVGGQQHPSLNPDVDLGGGTTIPQLYAVLKLCDLLVTIDSLPLHAAQAVGIPVVGLFGCTEGRFICTSGSKWEAVSADPSHPDAGRRHRETGTFVAADDSVMRTISVGAVLEAIEKLQPATIAA